MNVSIMELVAEAKNAVMSLAPSELLDMMKDSNVLVVDVRDHPEVAQTGKIAGAIHVTRGMLEFEADVATPYFNPVFSKEKTVVLYCASGSRSALCANALKGIGYENVRIFGGFREWLRTGGPVEPA